MASKQIRISDELHKFLTSQAIKKDESYDQIIKRLLQKLWNVEIKPESDTE